MPNIAGKIGEGPAMEAQAPHIPGMQPVGEQKTANGGMNAAGQQQAPDLRRASLLSVLGSFQLGARLSADGEAYVKAIIDSLTDARSAAGTFEVRKLQRPAESLLVSSGKRGIVLLFKEALQDKTPYPAIAYEEEAQACVAATMPDMEVINYIVVIPEDYVKVRQMINYLSNTLRCVDKQMDADLVNDMFRGVNILVSDNPDDYNRVIDALDPHAVPLRADLKLTVFASSQKNRNNSWDEHDQFFGPASTDRMPIGCIGGYVEFARDSYATQYKYFPIVHITEIQAAIPSARLIPLFLALAMRRWIQEGQWKMQYTKHFTASAAGVVNIGSLFPDASSETGRFVVDNINTFNQLMSEAFHDAQLVMEVNEGRAKIVGIEAYAGEATMSVPMVVDQINRFYNKPLIDVNFYASNGTVPFRKEDTVFRGTFNYGATKMDSAYIDFLTEYVKHPSEAVRLEQLTFKRNWPVAKFNDMKEVEPDMQSLYMTSVVSFDPVLVQTMSVNLAVMPQTNMLGEQMYDMSSLANASKRWGQVQQNAWYSNNYAAAGYNPIQPIYGFQR